MGSLIWVAMLSILAVAPGLWAQTTGTIQGTITGPNNAPLQGVQVVLAGAGVSRTVSTDQDGFYSIPDLPPGTYRLTASLEPFSPREMEPVELQPGQELTLNLALESLTFGGEVLVTVQKRTTTLLEIPASVTVLTSDTIERQRVESLDRKSVV